MDLCVRTGLLFTVRCGNGTLIYGSYLSDEENIPAAAARVAFFDTLAAILAALVIIPAMATTGAKLDQGGPGLLFIFLPHLIQSMPGGPVIAMIFFVAVLCSDRGHRSGDFGCDPGNCIRLDGCAVDLYLSAWSRACRDYVLLVMRKRLCGRADQ